MGKSKYPSQLDTSVEIPAVRDNILEVGSEVINSLRHAIFQIERTLGVNPQGASGNTVTSRLDKVVDGNGNIKKEALTQANVLAGPVTDADVSKVAAIRETKLKLDYPTKLLQSEISVLGNQIDALVSQLEDMNSILSVHVHPDAKNRHKATAISVETSTISTSSEATAELDGTDVQAVLSSLYDGHINYDGSDITETNRSHEAMQIFFDDTNVSALVPADNAQDAIEGAINAATLSQINHQDLYHANGFHRVSKIYSADDSTVGTPVISEETITFAKNVGDSDPTFLVTFSSPYEESELTVENGDVLTILDENDDDSLINGDYQIYKVSRDGDGYVESVNVFGTSTENSSASVVGTVRKAFRRKTNQAGLLVTARQSADLTSAKVLQVCDPNAVRVISRYIRPAEITASSNTLSIEVDETDTYDFELHDSTKTRQSIDSLIVKFNEKAAEDKIPLTAYRLDQEAGGSELVIAHIYPDESDNFRSLKLSQGSDDGITALGFSHIEDVKVVAVYGSPFSIKGKDYNGLVEKLDTTDLVFFAGLRTVSVGEGSTDFEEIGIREGDVLLISGSEEANDNGAFVIEAVNATELTLDNGQLPSGFTSSSGEDLRFLVYSNTLNIESITFKEVSGSFSCALVDVFMDENRSIFGQTAIEYATTLNGTNALFEIVDYSGELDGQTITLSIEKNDSGTGVDVSLDGGDALHVLGKDNYIKVCSGTYSVEFTLLIDDADEVYTWIDTNSTISTSVYTFKQLDTHSNLHIARVPFGSFSGRVIGGPEGTGRITSILEKGGLGVDDIATSAKYALIERPLDELRSNGVVKNVEISGVGLDDGKYQFTLSAGVFYVGGLRYDYPGGSYITDLDSGTYDKIFIFANTDGNICFEAALSAPACTSPASDSDVVSLYTLEYSSSTTYAYDMRLFITDLDLKVLNAVIVSNQPGMGHFTDLRKALDYTRRFSQIFPKAGTPSVHFKSGTYDITTTHDYASVTGVSYINWVINFDGDVGSTRKDYYDALYENGLLVDFPVTITGEGDSTIFKLRDSFEFSDGTLIGRGPFVFVGSAFAQTTKPITAPTSGFTSIKDIRFEQSSIGLLDYNIYDPTSGDAQFYGVDIESCIFDLGDDTDGDIDIDVTKTAILFGEESDTSNEKGNLTISKCKFLRGFIRTGDFGASFPTRMNNITVMGCSMYGEFDDGMTKGDIFSLDSADREEEHNICFVGNQHFSNQNTLASGNGPDMIDAKGGDRWGERFSRDVHVGAELDVKGAIVTETSVESPTYTYDATKTFTQVITFEHAVNATGGPASYATNNVTYSYVFNVSNGLWWRMDIPTGDSAYVRIFPPSGVTIEDIIIGVSRGTTSATQYDWTAEIHTQALDSSGTASVWGSSTVTSTEQGSGNKPVIASFTDINLAVNSDDNLYWLEILHDQASTEEVYWIKIVYDVSNLEETLGLS
jgi:hypothetical protein